MVSDTAVTSMPAIRTTFLQQLLFLLANPILICLTLVWMTTSLSLSMTSALNGFNPLESVKYGIPKELAESTSNHVSSADAFQVMGAFSDQSPAPHVDKRW